MSLFAMTTDFLRLLGAIENGEIPEEAIADTLDSVNAAWGDKADEVISAIKQLRAEINAIKEEEAALHERIKRKNKTAERLCDYIAESIKALGKDKYESAKHLVTFRISKTVRITDEEAFISYAMLHYPEAVRTKETLEPNKDIIKKLLKSVDLPYVAIDVNENIQIK